MNTMMRVRLKADGRIVEILPDGTERELTRAATTGIGESGESRRGRLCARRARADQADPGRVRVPHRRADRDRAQLGAGQALAARPARALLKLIEKAPQVAFAVLSTAKTTTH